MYEFEYSRANREEREREKNEPKEERSPACNPMTQGGLKLKFRLVDALLRCCRIKYN